MPRKMMMISRNNRNGKRRILGVHPQPTRIALMTTIPLRTNAFAGLARQTAAPRPTPGPFYKESRHETQIVTGLPMDLVLARLIAACIASGALHAPFLILDNFKYSQGKDENYYTDDDKISCAHDFTAPSSAYSCLFLPPLFIR